MLPYVNLPVTYMGQGAIPTAENFRYYNERQGNAMKPMKIQESAENYLEAILMLKQEKGMVRSVDISRHMNFTKPSVSRAVGLLRDNNYIIIDTDGWIELTDAGREIAEKIYERHQLVTKWLIALGVPDDIAAEDACRIEHDLSSITFEKLKEHILRPNK